MRNSVDCIIVGAGIAGIYSLYKLRQSGLSVELLEAASGVGGVWFWNRYPGARCDIDSIDYSYSFSNELQQEWTWPERYASQPEILRYLNHVVDRFDLRKSIRFDSRVTAARYDEQLRKWRVLTENDEVTARYLIMATGLLSAPSAPNIPGLDHFKGPIYATATWPKDAVSFSGQRVGVFGTGSSGIQVTPVIAREASQVIVFQRTPTYSMPAQNAPLAAEQQATYKARYPALRDEARKSLVGTFSIKFDTPSDTIKLSAEERQRIYEECWRRGGIAMLGAPDVGTDLAINRTCADFVRAKIKQVVKDPIKADKLLPAEDLPLGCKRLIVDVGYYETFNRDNVDLVDLRKDPLQSVESGGVRTKSAFVGLDAIILATGFEALTGALKRIDIHGRGGTVIRDRWRDGPRNYLGMAMRGFPNLFMINGPFCTAGNFMTTTEIAVEWIADLIRFSEANGAREVEVIEGFEETWIDYVRKAAEPLVSMHGCNAWWTTKQPASKSAPLMMFMGGVGEYRNYCLQVAQSGYTGFEFRS